MRCLYILLLFALAYALPFEDGDRQKRGILLLLLLLISVIKMTVLKQRPFF